MSNSASHYQIVRVERSAISTCECSSLLKPLHTGYVGGAVFSGMVTSYTFLLVNWPASNLIGVPALYWYRHNSLMLES
jgi:hypothetical protein